MRVRVRRRVRVRGEVSRARLAQGEVNAGQGARALLPKAKVALPP